MLYKYRIRGISHREGVSQVVLIADSVFSHREGTTRAR